MISLLDTNTCIGFLTGRALLIAAVGLAQGLVLVTHDTGEFSRIPGLRCEDWETA